MCAPSMGVERRRSLNSPAGCEGRRDRRRGLADGVLAVPAAKTGRGVGKPRVLFTSP